MNTAEARHLLAYNGWANARVFAAVDGLSSEQLTRIVASSFPTVIATLAHIVSTEWVWLRRWMGESPASVPDWVARAELSDLRARLTAVDSERAAFVNDLTDGGLEDPIAYRTLSGQPHEDRLSHTLRHVVNHSTYRRGQVATQLRQLGIAPPATDFIAYVWQAR